MSYLPETRYHPRIQRVEVFKTEDGEEHKTFDEAKAHYDLLAKCKEIMKPFGEPTRQQEGYRQHSRHLLIDAKLNYLRAVQHLNIHLPRLIERFYHVDSSHFDCILREVTKGYVYKTWRRLNLIDDMGREFYQPYYLRNPEKAILER